MKLLRARHAGCHALSLMELVIVVGVLAITTGLISYSLNPNTLTVIGVGRSQTSPTIVTLATMKVLKESILGANGQPGLWTDMDKVNRAFPQFTASLFVSPDQVAAAAPGSYLASSTNAQWFKNLVSFNPKTGKGWRGPYLSVNGGSYPFTQDGTNRLFTGDLQPQALGSIPVPIDGWGNPIIIQWGILTSSEVSSLTTDAADRLRVNNARMISAGPNGVLDSNSSAAKSKLFKYTDFVADRATGGAKLSGDDVITFFFYPDLQ